MNANVHYTGMTNGVMALVAVVRLSEADRLAIDALVDRTGDPADAAASTAHVQALIESGRLPETAPSGSPNGGDASTTPPERPGESPAADESRPTNGAAVSTTNAPPE